MANRKVPADDETIVMVVTAFPRPSFVHSVAKAGIVNAEGAVYREVWIYNLLEMLTLTAKLNALGYTLTPSLRETCGRQYSALYSRNGR